MFYSLLGPIFKVILRLIAWVSTGILFLIFFAVLAVANLQSLMPEFLKALDDALGEMVEFEQVEVSLHGIAPKIQVHGLELRRSSEDGEGLLVANFLEVRFAQPLWNTDGFQIDYIGVDSPRLTGQFDLAQIASRRGKGQGADGFWSSGAVLSRLSNIRAIEVSNGQFDLQLNSHLIDKTVEGQFDMNIDQNDDVHSLSGSVFTSWNNPSTLNFRIDMTNDPDGKPAAELQLQVNSLDLVWLSLFLPATDDERALDLDKISAVANSHIRANWTDNRFDSLDWSLLLADPSLGSSDSAASLNLTGNWQRESSLGSDAQINFSVNSLNATTLLANYGIFFPPRFYAFMSPRLRSLNMPELSGRLEFSPAELIHSKTYDLLEVDARYTDLTFEFNQKWPLIDDGKGVISVQGRTVDIDSEEFFFNGIEINDAVANVADLLEPDPILTLAMSALVPAKTGLDFFGADGRVNPGQIEWITSMQGDADVKLDIRVPLRRGKQFTMDGDISTQNMTLQTNFDVEATDINGTIKFGRKGLTKGDIQGEILGGGFTTTFEEETGDILIVNGSASGKGQVKALDSLLGESIVAQMSGDFTWDASYSWKKGHNTISLTTLLEGVESRLPLPLSKQADTEMPLSVSIETKDKIERKADFRLSPLLVGQVQMKRNEQQWLIDKGVISIGRSQLPPMLETGVNVDLYAPILDLDAWTSILDDKVVNVDLNYRQSLQRLEMIVGYLFLSRQRVWSNVKTELVKQEDFWDIQVDSDQFKGVARYRDEGFLEEGEVPSFEAELSKCHMAEAQGPLNGEPVDPSTLPRISIQCADTVYGQYQLGESTIIAEPEQDRWAIKTANFTSPHLEVKAEGEWLHSQTTNIRFESASSDFGATMKSLGYDGTFLNGQMDSGGTLSWNDALTNWSAEKTSGTVGLIGSNVFIQTGMDTTGLNLIGFFNYEVFLDNLSKEISDIDEEGVFFDSIVGDANIESGNITFPAIVFDNPSVEILASGSTNWSTKELDLLVGVSPKVGKSLTLIATLINPATGLYTYLSNELLDSLDFNLFNLQYSIAGTWKTPEMILLKKQNEPKDATENK